MIPGCVVVEKRGNHVETCLGIRPHCCPAKLVFWHGFRSKHEKTLRFTQLCCNIHTCCLALECWLAALRSVSKPDLKVVWHGRAARIHMALVAWCWNAGWLSDALSRSQIWNWFGTGVPHTSTLMWALD